MFRASQHSTINFFPIGLADSMQQLSVHLEWIIESL